MRANPETPQRQGNPAGRLRSVGAELRGGKLVGLLVTDAVGRAPVGGGGLQGAA